MKERLQKILANAGVASRRKCEELIKEGKVAVNDKVVTTLGIKADPSTDVITIDGERVRLKVDKLILAFYKPKGVITSTSDPRGRKTVIDFVRGVGARVYPVGRLDYDTEGILLLTNDGELANMLMHPRHHVEKIYLVTVQGVPHGDKLEQLQQGIKLDDGMTRPAMIEYHDVDLERNIAVISIKLHEGRNRQIRRMFEAIGHPVIKLKRVKFGNITLQGLVRGKYRVLRKSEINELRMEIKSNRTLHT